LNDEETEPPQHQYQRPLWKWGRAARRVGDVESAMKSAVMLLVQNTMAWLATFVVATSDSTSPSLTIFPLPSPSPQGWNTILGNDFQTLCRASLTGTGRLPRWP